MALPAPVVAERRARAAALPPDERRAAIASATAELLLRHGPSVTTRQIAEAAGIAEGTIFRVFEDKDAVLRAAFDAVLDPVPAEAALAAIPADLPLEDQLARAVTILQQRHRDIWQVLSAVWQMGAEARPERGGPPPLQALIDLMAAHADALRVAPPAAAHQLRMLVIATSHPMIETDAPLTADDVVSLFLDGTRRRDDADDDGAAPTRRVGSTRTRRPATTR